MGPGGRGTHTYWSNVSEERSLEDLLEALRWRWPLVVLIALGITLGAVAYVEALPAQYSSESLVALTPEPENEQAGADSVRLVAPSFVAYLQAPSTLEQVAGSLGTTPGVIEDSVSVSLGADSGNITITATDDRPGEAKEISDAFADALVDFSRSSDLLQAQVIAPAVTPRTPSGPPRKLLELAAAVVGIALGIGVALLLERGRPRIRSWRDITELTGYTVLARMPRTRILRARPTEAFGEPRVGAAIRTLRTNVERASLTRSEEGVRTVMITSAAPGDGKTTIAALYAESLARLGNKVLLIDADLNRAGLTKQFAVNGQIGTATVLREKADFKGAIQNGWVENLHILPTQIEPEAGDLIAREFGDLLDRSRSTFDVVVVDGPPLIGTDAARTIATLVTGVLLVVSAGSTTAPVNESVMALEDLKAPVLGVIGNRLPRVESGHSYR